MKEDREVWGKCKCCQTGIYHVSGEKGGRPPAFCSDECKHEYQTLKAAKRRRNYKSQRQYREEVEEIVRPKGKTANKSLDDILADLKAEGKGPGDFGEYKRLKALEGVTPIIL